MTAAPGGRRTLLLFGLDVGDRLVWAWEWEDGREGRPDHAVLPHRDQTSALTRLRRALPDALPEDAEADPSSLPRELREGGERRSQVELAVAWRAATGALTDAREERLLARDLGAALLPPRLLDALRDAARGGEVELRVLPTPGLAHVPWGMLGTGVGDERLIELCAVTIMAPTIARDREHSDEGGSEGSPLYLIDPDVSRDRGILPILGDEGRRAWVRRLGGYGGVRSDAADRLWLSKMLLSEPRSRFFYVGHVSSESGSGGQAALELNDPRSVYDPVPLAPHLVDRRRFTALAALNGTRGARDHLDDLGRAGRRLEFGRDHPLVPSIAQKDGGGIRELHGAHIWPMPPRVALIACRSGGDMAHAEPFGLVTVMFELGAQIVTATRWPLLTDGIATVLPSGVRSGLAVMSLQLDSVHAGPDLIGGLAVWQRRRLRMWRRWPSLATSPLGFAAVANHVLPGRAPSAIAPM